MVPRLSKWKLNMKFIRVNIEVIVPRRTIWLLDQRVYSIIVTEYVVHQKRYNINPLPYGRSSNATQHGRQQSHTVTRRDVSSERVEEQHVTGESRLTLTDKHRRKLTASLTAVVYTSYRSRLSPVTFTFHPISLPRVSNTILSKTVNFIIYYTIIRYCVIYFKTICDQDELKNQP